MLLILLHILEQFISYFSDHLQMFHDASPPYQYLSHAITNPLPPNLSLLPFPLTLQPVPPVFPPFHYSRRLTSTKACCSPWITSVLFFGDFLCRHLCYWVPSQAVALPLPSFSLQLPPLIYH